MDLKNIPPTYFRVSNRGDIFQQSAVIHGNSQRNWGKLFKSQFGQHLWQVGLQFHAKNEVQTGESSNWFNLMPSDILYFWSIISKNVSPVWLKWFQGMIPFHDSLLLFFPLALLPEEEEGGALCSVRRLHGASVSSTGADQHGPAGGERRLRSSAFPGDKLSD